MDRWVREDRHGRRRENPSFSSTLLDEIYRSIDEGHGKEREEELILYRESTMRKKQSSGLKEQEEGMAGFRRACMIEKWMDKKVNEKVVVRRNSTADIGRKSRNDLGFDHLLQKNSSSSSSDSSSGGGFSSSESSESVYALKSRSSCYGVQRPKPIRTSFSGQNPQSEKPKHESGFVKTKSKALKIYGDLKKVKQPISPGGRLASFLNSLFTAGNAKKAKMSSSDETSSERKSKSTATSTCSSASSFSRSCLSNTSSSRGKFSNGGGVKRSVRFCPRVSVIVDEDCRPKDAEIKCYVMGGNYRVEEVTKDLLQNYQKKTKEDLVMKDVLQEDSDDDDDDAASYSSSDLFELDNLSAIGIERYRQELPVYETTHLDTNRAIANGLIL